MYWVTILKNCAHASNSNKKLLKYGRKDYMLSLLVYSYFHQFCSWQGTGKYLTDFCITSLFNTIGIFLKSKVYTVYYMCSLTICTNLSTLDTCSSTEHMFSFMCLISFLIHLNYLCECTELISYHLDLYKCSISCIFLSKMDLCRLCTDTLVLNSIFWVKWG